MHKRYTARIVVLVEHNNRLYLVTILDSTKSSKLSGVRLALPGGGNHEGEFPFQTALRELWEETGLSPSKALGQLRELGVVHLATPGRPPHDVVFFEVRFPYEYVTETLKAIKSGSANKLEKYIEAGLLEAPIDSHNFLRTHYEHLAQVAPELHRKLFI